ncbi:MAG: zinc ribbon domain-containing protein [SAR86 cluster bacterium]|jgi:putative FmdB family regulatory protein|nr:transcriptional regulator [Gammaproteobacteria bacterium]MBL6683374.1 zinc ribbon domain-containing protein [SAR86 cluster bacterium]MEC7167302.1 zinc ribbon domain-containing protein [Pseudomonadota bacterium]MBL6810608.1 zinc ribbon domain-containing protein [SAR86 cluster bacterium]MEC7804708.1 zinc ribbon domain-containing protein [Pseudomonadota bacterium]|tara:strand:+ start:2656 stop:2904 length:249 start_codon:yes stop_codon:yes gene_type:complete
MPIYEYYCEVCKSNFELIQKISDKPAKKCIKCNKSTKVVKLVSAPGFRLKGGGWYETDFKSGSKKNIHDSENKMTKTGKKEN